MKIRLGVGRRADVGVGAPPAGHIPSNASQSDCQKAYAGKWQDGVCYIPTFGFNCHPSCCESFGGVLGTDASGSAACFFGGGPAYINPVTENVLSDVKSKAACWQYQGAWVGGRCYVNDCAKRGGTYVAESWDASQDGAWVPATCTKLPPGNPAPPAVEPLWGTAPLGQSDCWKRGGAWIQIEGFAPQCYLNCAANAENGVYLGETYGTEGDWIPPACSSDLTIPKLNLPLPTPQTPVPEGGFPDPGKIQISAASLCFASGGKWNAATSTCIMPSKSHGDEPGDKTPPAEDEGGSSSGLIAGGVIVVGALALLALTLRSPRRSR